MLAVNTKSGDKMKEKRVFEQRGAVVMLILMLLLFVSVLRVLTVMSTEELGAAAVTQSSYKLIASHPRGTVFDCEMHKLTNSTTRTVAAVMPSKSAFDSVKPYLLCETAEELEKRLADGKPVLVSVSKEVNTDEVKSIRISVNQSSDQLASHLIGYTDGSGHGVSGVQGACDALLYSDFDVGFSYTCNARGEFLPSYGIECLPDGGVETDGICLTLNTKIQAAVEEAAADMKSGAVVVSEVGSGKIRALSSFPDFNVTAVENYLEDEASPLINRAFCAYNVGSVFKPCVAAAALELEGFSKMSYECMGQKLIGGKAFNCHVQSGHGLISLKDAIAKSCNTYFYTLAISIGAEEIYKIASSFGFGQKYNFYDGLSTESGNLPAYFDVEKSEQSKANLAIGQGELLLTPVSLLPLYEAIANGGVYCRPSLIEGTVEGGVLKGSAEPVKTRAMSEETAEELRLCLYEVINRGTGAAARPKTVTAAGKTATAQTGWITDGKRVDHSWFCGFFPAENPRYTVIVFSENTSGGGTACAPVFAKIADAINGLNLS